MMLGALDDGAVAEIAADVLGAEPDRELLALAAAAGGNPFVLVELLGGPRDEGAVEVSGDRVRLVSRRPPRRDTVTGVRRRHWTQAGRPVSGWAGLTETERDVATLVARGLTNRQVATRMFVAPHTVKFHLRRVFRKLDIVSRVELARLAAERAQGGPAVPGADEHSAGPA